MLQHSSAKQRKPAGTRLHVAGVPGPGCAAVQQRAQAGTLAQLRGTSVCSFTPIACLPLQFGAWFCLNERKSTFTLEMRAGTVTFLTVSGGKTCMAAVYTAVARMLPSQHIVARMPCTMPGAAITLAFAE